MKRIIHLAVALIGVLMFAAAAARVSAENLTERTGNTGTNAKYELVGDYLTICPRNSSVETTDTGKFPYDNIVIVEIQEGITEISKNAFQNCTNLSKVILPSTVTFIDESAFAECASLEEIQFSEGLESIGTSAFFKCTSLKSVSFPSTLTSLGNYSFQNCTALKSVTFLSSNVKMTKIPGSAPFKDVGTLDDPVYLSYPDTWTKPMTEGTPWYGGYFTFTPPAQESTPGNTHQLSGTRTASTAEKDIIHYQLSCGVQNTNYAVCGAGCNIYRGEAVGTDPALITNDKLAEAVNPANAFSVFYDIDINTDYTNELTVLFWYTIRHLDTGETTQIFVNSGVSPATSR
ncbi:MAG: leucine-rich repeat domain-containing protein [Oscillospiraceae bacterium]|nr:leucine-rich repeat domain-containing protein [Oscillospiraceae bacterium]